MGQKTHPKGFRLGITQTWDSQWFATSKNYGDLVFEDRMIRDYVKRKLFNAGISRIEIFRKAQLIQINIHAVRPGIVVGKGGQGLDVLRNHLISLIHRKDVIVQVNVLEVSKADLDSQLVGEAVAQQLERRVAFRKAMKQAMQRTMRAGAKGIKIMVSGRLGGTDIARTEWLREGAIPLHTLRADIDYAYTTATTIFGIIGVKVWIYKGLLEQGEFSRRSVTTPSEKNLEENPDETFEEKRRRKRKERRGQA